MLDHEADFTNPPGAEFKVHKSTRPLCRKFTIDPLLRAENLCFPSVEQTECCITVSAGHMFGRSRDTNLNIHRNFNLIGIGINNSVKESGDGHEPYTTIYSKTNIKTLRLFIILLRAVRKNTL